MAELPPGPGQQLPQLPGQRHARFLTPPKRHQYETRCYIRDPDGYLIEVGQTTDPQGDWSPAHWPSLPRDDVNQLS